MRSKSSKKGSILIGGDDLSSKIYQTMEKHKEVSILRMVVHLYSLLVGDCVFLCGLRPPFHQVLPHLPTQVFFVVLLQPPTVGATSPLPGTTDPDQLIACDLMDGRDAFLTMAREKHWEFSSLRRGMYSSMAMLYELHNQSGDRFVYTCNHCRMHVETRFHCKECDVSSRFSTENSLSRG